MTENTYTTDTTTFNTPQTFESYSSTFIDPNKVLVKLSSTAVAPSYQSDGSAGSDLRCLNRVALLPNVPTLIDTGVAIALPRDTAGLVYLRSSIALQGILLCNGVGVIDPDYRGTIKLLVTNTCSTTVVFQQGDRLAQLLVTPILTPSFKVMTELDTTNRADGGFGSTGIS